MDEHEDDDWSDDPQQLAEITAAAGLVGPFGGDVLYSAARSELSVVGTTEEKVPCHGITPKKKQGDLPPDERLVKLGEVTLSGFEKINSRLTALERQRGLSSLNKGCVIVMLGYGACLVFLVSMALLFHLLGV